MEKCSTNRFATASSRPRCPFARSRPCRFSPLVQQCVPGDVFQPAPSRLPGFAGTQRPSVRMIDESRRQQRNPAVTEFPARHRSQIPFSFSRLQPFTQNQLRSPVQSPKSLNCRPPVTVRKRPLSHPVVVTAGQKRSPQSRDLIVVQTEGTAGNRAARKTSQNHLSRFPLKSLADAVEGQSPES